MRISLFAIAVILLVSSCSRKNKIPRDVLPQEKMQSVLWDIMRADQFLSDYVLNKDTTLDKTKERLKYYQQVFSIHKISKEEFDRSLAFYNTKPDLFKAIMDSISAPPRAENKNTTEKVVKPVIVADTIEQQPVKPIQ